MKTFVGTLLVAACFVACAHSYPGLLREMYDSDESEDKSGGQPVVSVPAFRPFIMPSFSLNDDSDDPMGFAVIKSIPSMDDFMLRMHDVIRRLKEQIMSFVPEQPGIMPWGKIPEGGNTTSITKNINGHEVTINETTYSNGDDESRFVIRVRTVDVKPENDATETEPDAEVTTLPSVTATATAAAATGKESTTTPARSVETVEDFDNTIPKNQEDTLNA